jgi:acetyl-CoA carboxylase carboxyltransferase component
VSASEADSWEALLAELERRKAFSLTSGGADRVEREHGRGRLVARERIDLLADPGSFRELGGLATTPAAGGEQLPSSLVCGICAVDGRPVAVAAEDFMVAGGGVGVHLARLKGSWGGFIEELAYEYRIPLVILLNGVGGSIVVQEVKGYPALVSTMTLFPMLELLSRVPVVAAVMGPTGGSSAARATLSHFSLINRPSGCLFVAGPPVVRQALGTTIDKMDLGGADVHLRSGVIDNGGDSDADVCGQIRQFLAYLPRNVWELPGRVETGDPVDRPIDEVLEIVSPNGRRPYDCHALIRAIVDRDTFFELAPEYGPSLRVGLARIDGHAVGILASDSRHLAGALDGPSSDKQARFAELCDTFHLPIVYLADVPGFMVGPDAEKTGVLRRGTRAVAAIQRVSVPVFSIQVRRAYGMAAQGTGSTNRLSLRIAWPSGEWGDMPVSGGIEAEFRPLIESAPDPEAKRKELLEQFAYQTSIWRTVEKFGVEEMIDPRDTRKLLAELLALTEGALTPGPKAGPQVRP